VRRNLSVVTALVVASTLTGCVPQAEPTGAPTASGTPTSVPTASPSSTPAPTAEPGATPVDLTCEQVLSAQQLFDYNSIYSAVDEAPDAGTLAAEAVALGGVACRWVNTSSGSPIDISVAQPAPAQWDALQGTAGDATGYGFFAGGVAQAFPGAYWVTVGSPDFTVADDPAPLVETVVGNLG
jgi:hypothetical protein